MFKEVRDAEEGRRSAEERTLRACVRVFVTTPWCFMCPWETKSHTLFRQEQERLKIMFKVLMLHPRY